MLMLIGPDITRETKRSSALPPLVVLCTALRFFACGSLLLVLGDTYWLSAATVCRFVYQVTEALLRRTEMFIKMPCEEALPTVKQEFYDIASKLLIADFRQDYVYRYPLKLLLK